MTLDLKQAEAAGKVVSITLLDSGLPRTFSLFKKKKKGKNNAESMKYNKTKCNKMRSAYRFRV